MNNRYLIYIFSLWLISLAALSGCTPASPAATPIPSSTATQLILPTIAAPTHPPTPTFATVPPSPVPTASPVPTIASTISTELVNVSVILVPDNETLSVHQDPNESSKVIASLPPETTGVIQTGKRMNQGDTTWVEITNLGKYTGWVNGYYLTEEVDREAFCQDTRVSAVLDKLGRALQEKDGNAFKELVSPLHGLTVYEYHTGNAVNFSPEEAGWVFKSTFETNWGHHPASDLETTGTFSKTVLPDLLDVFAGQQERTCMQITTGPINYTAALPDGFQNVSFISIYRPGPSGEEMNWRTWIAGFEYLNGTPYLFSLHQFFWEP
jgi:hypothetical protein